MATNKDFKYYHLLNLINHLGPISRTELASITDYRSGSIGDIVKEMIDENIVIESGHVSVGHGRSRTMLVLNYSQLSAIGISITQKKLNVSLSNAEGQIIGAVETRLNEFISHQDIIAKADDSVGKLLGDFPKNIVVGIGIACPSYDPIYHESATLESNYMHYNDWITIELKTRLENHYSIPVNTFSAIGLPAIAEYHFGSAKGTQNFICVELSNGIGSSLFCNGRMYSGCRNVAGQLGHTIIDMHSCSNTICSCGKAGCVEATSAWPALKADIQNAVLNGAYSSLLGIINVKSDFLAKDVGICIEEGDQLCRHFVKSAAQRLGIAISNLVNLMNPEKVILHGFMLELGSYFINELKSSIQDHTLSLSAGYEIIVSESFESIVPLGAAAEILSSYLRASEYEWVYSDEYSSYENNSSKHADL